MGHVDKAATTLSNLSTRSEHKAETKAADDERKGEQQKAPEDRGSEAKDPNSAVKEQTKHSGQVDKLEEARLQRRRGLEALRTKMAGKVRNRALV